MIVILTETIRLRILKIASQAEAREDGTRRIGLYDQEATTPHSNYGAKTKSSYSDFGHNQPNVPAVSTA
jgi:hypothetical protein